MKHFMPDNGLYVYERRAGDDSFIVVMNGRDKENEVDMSRYAEIIPEGKVYRDVVTGEIIELRPSGSKNRVFTPRETRILQSIK